MWKLFLLTKLNTFSWMRTAPNPSLFLKTALQCLDCDRQATCDFVGALRKTPRLSLRVRTTFVSIDIV